MEKAAETDASVSIGEEELSDVGKETEGEEVDDVQYGKKQEEEEEEEKKRVKGQSQCAC